jgi:hypothetical protein
MSRYFLSIKAFSLGLLAVSALLLVTGCGGSSSEAAGDGEVTVEAGSLSKAEFIEQADAICEERRDQFDREFQAQSQRVSKELANADPKSQAQIAEAAQSAIITSIFIPTYEQMAKEIGTLGVPSDDKGEVTSFVQAVQKALSEAKEDPAATFEQLTPFGQAIKIATSYGLTECAKKLG